MADDTSPVPDPTALDPAADLVSKRRARKWVWAMVGLVFVLIIGALYLGRQTDTSKVEAPKAFCRAANAYDKELVRQQINYRRDIDKHIEYVQAIVDAAPKAVRPDAQRFLDQLLKVQAAPNEKAREKLLDDPDVRQAVVNVNRYWNQGCGVFDRKGGI